MQRSRSRIGGSRARPSPDHGYLLHLVPAYRAPRWDELSGAADAHRAVAARHQQRVRLAVHASAADLLVGAAGCSALPCAACACARLSGLPITRAKAEPSVCTVAAPSGARRKRRTNLEAPHRAPLPVQLLHRQVPVETASQDALLCALDPLVPRDTALRQIGFREAGRDRRVVLRRVVGPALNAVHGRPHTRCAAALGCGGGHSTSVRPASGPRALLQRASSAASALPASVVLGHLGTTCPRRWGPPVPRLPRLRLPRKERLMPRPRHRRERCHSGERYGLCWGAVGRPV
mmetsp:Transcript_39032/g.111733  ORF Transcript_39032/g.111733 Transcript_39032/m.111733 type:complete len:291 (-) Transcript_39032:41-913(-)